MNTRTCENCDTPCGPDDVFCENCGYDFITGSLPSDAPDVGTAEGAGEVSLPAAPSVLDLPEDGARIRLSVAVDRAYFDEVVNDGEIDFPDPVPGSSELELFGEEIHIGRTSESRAIHPDIDVADLTGDQAVSSRHAVLKGDDEGGYRVIDVGSTNGTFIDDITGDALSPGTEVDLVPGTSIYVGAWTRITVLASDGTVPGETGTGEPA
ncbi:MAG: FHA domain-containing protein [Actinomycetota bacterium]